MVNEKNATLTSMTKALIFAAVLLFCIMMLALLFQWKVYHSGDMSTGAVTANTPMVILDAGHGGVDSGTVAPDGTEEKHLNLSLTKKLGAFLEACGVQVIYTRTEDTLLTTQNAPTRKTGDLMARVALAKEYPDAVFVSIHMNALPQRQYSGLQTFYSTNHAWNESLAKVIQNDIRQLQADNHREAKDVKGSVYVLDRIQNPAVLIECGFLSNPEESVLLQQEEYQNKLAFLLSHSILSFVVDQKI